MNWYIGVLKKYAKFNGRARRREFWMFFLWNLIIHFFIGIIEFLLKTSLLGNIYTLAILTPYLAVAVRRMHDTGRSGWWVICPIVNIVFLFFEGEHGDNKYGGDPKFSG